MNYIWYLGIALVIFIVFYIVFSVINIKKQQKSLYDVQASIEVGKGVLISGGIHGVVKGIKQQTLQVEVANGVVLEVERYAVMQIKK